MGECFRMPNEACEFDFLPDNDYRDGDISNTDKYLRICQYYDRFKTTFEEYNNLNWVPSKNKYNISFGVHYQCYKNNRATFEVLLNFRIYYPDIPIVLISDNGNDFSDMAEYFNCTYIYSDKQSGNGITNVLKHDNKTNLWLDRIKQTCEVLNDCEYVLYMEDDVLTRDVITKNPNADIAGPSNPDDFWWSPQIIRWMKENRPNVEINGLNGCGGTIFKRTSFLECFDNQPDYSFFGKLDDRLLWASDAILTFLFLYNKKTSRRWLDQSEESRGKIFGSTAFDHQHKYFYDKKWSECYLKNTDLDHKNNFIFTACSDNIFVDQFIPFYASLKEHTKFDGALVVIDYGLSDKHLSMLVDNKIRIIPGIGKFEIISDRFISANKYIQYLNNPNQIFVHYDCDVWFNKDISDVFDMCNKSKNAICTKDVWHCGFLHDCVSKEEYKEYNRNILFEVENRCGKVLQAGFIAGNNKFWNIYSRYLEKLINNKYLKDVFGADELVLNLLYHYTNMINVIDIGYNTLPQWDIKEIDGELFATDFHTDSHKNKNHQEPVFAIHFSSAARGKSEFDHIDFKKRHKDLFNDYKDLFNKTNKKQSETSQSPIDIVKSYGFRHLLPTMLKLLKTQILCEVGVQYGNNLFNMVFNSDVKKAYGVDMWKVTDNKAQNDIGLSQAQFDEIYDGVIKISEKKNISIIRKHSTIAAGEFKNGYFDFIYLDADHTYDGCRQDLESWWPKLKGGGILAGDDYVKAITPVGSVFGVIEAVNEFATNNELEVIHTANKDNKGSSPQWFIIKPQTK